MAEEENSEKKQSGNAPASQNSHEKNACSKQEHHEKIYNILMNQDEITWRTILLELIKSEEMDPWDVNISKLSRMYISTLKRLKEMNLSVSGKVLLAAALLLRIKSSKLVGDDLMEFDRLLASGQNTDLYSDENFVQEELGSLGITVGDSKMPLIPKTPQPRKRKVSVYDLIDALAIALNVKRRRILNQLHTRTTVLMPEKQIDLSTLMNDLYADVVEYLSREQKEKVPFSNLVPGNSKADKVMTFIPLLHLTNARRIDLEQHEHFGEIWVSVVEHKPELNKTEKTEPDAS